MRRGNLLSLGLSLVAALGCSSSKGTGDAGPDSGYALPPNPVDPLAACLDLAMASANLEVSCGRLAQSDVGDSASGYIGAQCPPFLFASQEAAFEAGQLAYSGATVSCMENALRPPSGDTSACNLGYPELDPLCGQLAWGTLGPGESCGDQYACGAGLYCQVGNVAGSCGVCTADVGFAMTCGVDGALCNSGNICNGEVCLLPVGTGQGCGEDSAVCRPPLTCHGEGCQLPQAIDGGCNGTADCAPGLSCNTFSSHCFPAPGAGGDCSEQPCGLGLACMRGDAGFSCAPLIAGGACIFTDAGPQCPEFESCRDGGCVPLSLLDGGCAVSSDCALGICSTGRCQLLSNGEPCGTSGQCQSGICDNSASEACVAGCQAAP